MSDSAVQIPEEAVAVASSPAGVAYRGKAGCDNVRCTTRGEPDRCYGWHCAYCHGTSNCQGNCSACDHGQPRA